MKIENVKIINHDSIIENADILIKNGKIIDITKKDGIAKSLVIPGFIDTHIHGFMGYECMRSKSDVEKMSVELQKVGTTSFFPTVMTQKTSIMEKSLKDISEANCTHSRMIGVHLEGPFISKKRKGAHNEEYITNSKIDLFEQLIKSSKNKIKLITFAPECVDDQFYKVSNANDIVLSIGHSDASIEECINAVKKGAKKVTHLWNAMSKIENRNEGVASLPFINKKIFAEVILDFIHIDKNTILLTLNSLGFDNVTLITDSLEAGGLPDGKYISGGLKVNKKGLKITLDSSPDKIAGSAICLYDSFINLMKLDISIQDSVKLLSYNAANLMGLKLNGQIKKGYNADINILDIKTLNLIDTLVGGKSWK